jgi:hypothetical protein
MIPESQIEAEMASEGCGRVQARNNILCRKHRKAEARRNWQARTRWTLIAGQDGERRYA